MWKSTEIRLTSGAAVLMVLALLWGAGPVMPHVLLAALCHELGHLAVLGLFRVPVESILVMPMGAIIRAPEQERLSYGRELLAVLAGAAVNFTLALVFARLSRDYLFAGANFLLGIYNLLPVKGLDGGRALYLLVAWRTEPFTALRVTALVNAITLAILAGLSVALIYYNGGGLFCLAGVFGMICSQFRVAKLQKRR